MTRCSSLLATLVAALLSFITLANAADKTWTGAGATRMISEGANWSDGLAPVTGDRLFFPLVGQTYVQNDLANASFDSLYFSGDDMGAFTLYGNPLTLTGAPTVVVSGKVVAFISLGISFPSQYVRFASTGAPIPGYRLPGLQFVPGMQLRFSGGLVEVAAEVGDIEVLANITENAPTSFQVQGGDVRFAGYNDFTGTFESFGGLLGIHSSNALGITGAGTYLGGDSRLYVGAIDGTALVIPESFVLDNAPDVSSFGSIDAYGPAPVRLTGDIVLLKPQVIETSTDLTIDGRVDGTGHVMIDRGDGTVTFTNSQNTFDGGISLSRGTLRAGNGLALGFMNSVDVETVGTVDLGATVQVLSDFTCRGATVKAEVAAAELSVSNAITLAGCSLAPSIAAGFIPQSRQVLTLIRNDTGAPIGGEFNFFGEGTVLDVNGVKTTATYHAGSGNDFAFVAETLPIVSLQLTHMPIGSVELGTDMPGRFGARGFDRFGRPAPGARVTFTSPPGCGTFNGSSSVAVTTDSTGLAMAPTFTAGTQSQVCFVQAQGDGGGSVNFELHLYALADVVMTPIPATLSTTVNQPFSVAVDVRGLNGISLPDVGVTFSAITRGNSGVASLTFAALTGEVSSRAVASGVANDKSGNYSIVAAFRTRTVEIPVSQKAK